MKKLLILPLLLVIATLACKRQESTSPDMTDADRLYSQLVEMITAYTDSMENAGDSADIARITAGFEKRWAEINGSVRPDTDYLLDEGRNDTITMLLDRYIAARRSKLKISEPASPDSISADESENIGNTHAQEAPAAVVHQ